MPVACPIGRETRGNRGSHGGHDQPPEQRLRRSLKIVVAICKQDVRSPLRFGSTSQKASQLIIDGILP